MKRALWMVAGSVLVSGACAIAKQDDGPIGQAIDAALDSIGLSDSTAVSDVRAEDGAPPKPTPTADDVPCDKSWSPAAGFTHWYGEKAYPGRSASELALGSGIVCGGPFAAPPGFCTSTGLMVRDGAAAVFCGTNADKAATAKIVMP